MTPAVVDRPAQRYVAERATPGIPGFPRIADRLPDPAQCVTDLLFRIDG
ncbi:hypothetical protein [Amycolatopsis balhimycina]|nr:hypothetical protein [Amycolatopsis balhimycina]